MASGVRGIEILKNELQRAKSNLKDVDDNIKKLTGHDHIGLRRPNDGGIKRRVSLNEDHFDGSERGRLFDVARRGLVSDTSHGKGYEGRVFGRLSDEKSSGKGVGHLFGRAAAAEDNDTIPAKRRAVGAFSRLGVRAGGMGSRLGNRPRRGPDSGEEEELDSKPSLQSSVVVTSKDTKTREEAVEQQNKDVKGRARNKRMFGALLGTLQRFKVEESQHEDKEKQRAEVEKKLEEKALEEKQKEKEERRTLFLERKKKQQHVKKLEHKFELVQIHEEWVRQTTILTNFIRTKAKPYIFYLPKGHTDQSKRKLSQSKKILEDVIKERQNALEEEIHEMFPSEKPAVVEEEMRSDEEQPQIGDVDDAMDTSEHADNSTKHAKTTQEEMGKENMENKTKRREDRVASGEKRRDRKKSVSDRNDRRNRSSRRRHSETAKDSSDKRRSTRHTRKDSTSQNSPKRRDSRRVSRHDKNEGQSNSKDKAHKKKRESREIKSTMQSLEDKYKDEDGENWGSGDENLWNDKPVTQEKQNNYTENMESEVILDTNNEAEAVSKPEEAESGDKPSEEIADQEMEIEKSAEKSDVSNEVGPSSATVEPNFADIPIPSASEHAPYNVQSNEDDKAPDEEKDESSEKTADVDKEVPKLSDEEKAVERKSSEKPVKKKVHSESDDSDSEQEKVTKKKKSKVNKTKGSSGSDSDSSSSGSSSSGSSSGSSSDGSSSSSDSDSESE